MNERCKICRMLSPEHNAPDGYKYCEDCWHKYWGYCKKCERIYERDDIDDIIEGDDCNSAKYCPECRERKEATAYVVDKNKLCLNEKLTIKISIDKHNQIEIFTTASKLLYLLMGEVVQLDVRCKSIK